jgi:hypothetical protein
MAAPTKGKQNFTSTQREERIFDLWIKNKKILVLKCGTGKFVV